MFVYSIYRKTLVRVEHKTIKIINDVNKLEIQFFSFEKVGRNPFVCVFD